MDSTKVLLDKLIEEYPNKATILEGKTEIERERYLAKLEMIEHIKLILGVTND